MWQPTVQISQRRLIQQQNGITICKTDSLVAWEIMAIYLPESVVRHENQPYLHPEKR
jgi:hypothetical protein